MESNNRNGLIDLNGKTITLGQYVEEINRWLREKEERKVVIPSYQRNYKWESTRAEKLVRDLIAVYKDNCSGNKKEKSIALFTLFLEDLRMDIVDGQQRFITLYLMFKALGKEDNFVSFEFERDGDENEINSRKTFIKRIDSIDKYTSNFSSDTRRFYYNYIKIKDVIYKEGLQISEYEDFITYIYQNVFLLLHVVKEQPIEEFLNINCNKTQFSVCDIVRAKVITGESRGGGWDPLDYEGILGNADYRCGVSALMEELSKFMYDKEIYDIVKSNYRINPDDTKENRINLFYNKFLTGESNSFLSDQIEQRINFDEKVEIIKLLQVLVFYRKILQEMEDDFGEKINSEDKDWTYRRILGELFKSFPGLYFFDLLEQYFDDRIDEHEDVTKKENMIAQILHEKFSIDKIVYQKISESSNEELYLINRYFESIASNKKDNESYSEIKNFKRNERKSEFFRVDKSDFNDLLQGAGKYLLYRYVSEKQRTNTLKLKAYHGKRAKETYEKNDNHSIENNMSVHKLFVESGFNIVIPDIQRDYCMGNHLERNEFMKFIKDAVDNDKSITISAITICNIKEGNRLYIYDGQQRCLTIAIIMKWLGIENISGFKFEHRDYFTKIWKEFFESNEKNLSMPEHSYSMNSVNKLIKNLESYKLDTDEKNKWIEYFRSEKITFDIISLPESLSAVDQFFMDFNEGVQLVPYEIFKCRLIYRCENVCDASEVAVFKNKLDNEWLEFFYKCKEGKIEDETASEELWEIRLLEFICRMIYWEKYISGSGSENTYSKHPLDFIEFSDNDTEMGDMEILINSLKGEDFKRIQKTVEELIKFPYSKNSKIWCVGIDYDRDERAGFWHFNSSDYNKEFILVRFIEGIKRGKMDKHDLIAWSVLNGDDDVLVKLLMEEWNAQSIISDAFAVLVPYKAGIWNHICLEIPEYYIPDLISDLEFQKQIENVMRKSMKDSAEIRLFYDDIMQKQIDIRNGKKTSTCEKIDWNNVKGEYATNLGELSNSDSVKIFYYRTRKVEAELYANGKKSKFLPCAKKDYIFLVDSQQQEGKWILGNVLTVKSDGSTAFMKDLGKVVKIDNTTKEVSISRYTKNGQMYYDETRYYL